MSDITWTDDADTLFAFSPEFGADSLATVTRWREDLFEWNAPIPHHTADGQLCGGRLSRHSGIAKTLEDAKLFVAVEVAMWFFRARPTPVRTPGGS